MIQQSYVMQDFRASRVGSAQLSSSPADLLPVGMHHFAEALKHVQASVRADDLIKYMNMPDPNHVSAALT